MKILLIGATGFIGSHIAKVLKAQGHHVVGCVRNPARDSNDIPCNFYTDTSKNVWKKRLKNKDCVINAVGIITQTRHNTFETVHTEAPKALFDACKDLKIKRIIHISALGVSKKSQTAYNNTKKAADDYLLSLNLPAVILRPSWLYGAGSRSFELLCAFSALPITPLVDNGAYKVQPIKIEEFARAVAWLVQDQTLSGIVEVGGAQKLPISRMHEFLRQWLKLKPTYALPIPSVIVKHLVKLGDTVFKGPVNSASFDMLTRNNVTDDTRLWERSGITPTPFEDALRAEPSVPAHTWHARMFFLLPLLRYSLAFVWLSTAGVSAFFGVPDLGTAATYCAVVLNIAMGFTLLFNYRLQLFGTLQVFLILAYSLFITFDNPEWWFHPYGPLLKNIPLLVATFLITTVTRTR